MNSTTLSSLSAAFLMAMIAVAQADNTANTAPENYTCDGQIYSGDYLAKPFPTFAPVIPDNLNVNGDFVQAVHPTSSWLLVTPQDKSMDCHQFMDEMEKTGIIEQIEPNWIATIQ